MRWIWHLDFFSNSMFYCTRTLIIRGELWPLKPFLPVPSQVCFLHETVCCRLIQPPSSSFWAADSSSPYQRSCDLFRLVLYHLLTLSFSLITFYMFILFPQIDFFTTYQRAASHPNFLSTYYVPGPGLGTSDIASFNAPSTPWSWELPSPFYKWETGTYTHCACDKLTEGHTVLGRRGAPLPCSSTCQSRVPSTGCLLGVNGGSSEHVRR